MESLQMVESAIQIFRCFREIYQTQRERLANHVKHAPWDFPSAMIFARFNQFLNRMLQLEVRSGFCFLYSGVTVRLYAVLFPIQCVICAGLV